jgi:hypothetical protein
MIAVGGVALLGIMHRKKHRISAIRMPAIQGAGDSGGVEAAADAGGDGKAARFIITLPPQELPYERGPPGISCSEEFSPKQFELFVRDTLDSQGADLQDYVSNHQETIITPDR